MSIEYLLVATNTGNVTLHNVSIVDPKLGTLTCTPTQPATLAPAAALSCTGSHTVDPGRPGCRLLLQYRHGGLDRDLTSH